MYMSNPSTEKALMHRFRNGDALAFNTIYNRYYSTLRYFSLGLICQKQQAEYIAVETFVKLYRLCSNFESMASVRAFLYVTARNACYDYLAYSHHQPEEPHEQAEDDNQDPLPPDTEAAIAAKALADAIENLPAAYYEVFKLAYLQGHKAIAIARYLRVNEQAVRNYKRRSIQLLRIALFEMNQLSTALTCLSLVKTNQAVSVQPLPSPLYIVTAG
jgi:RNA polymerase sigma-70 factor (ECF subfamily)